MKERYHFYFSYGSNNLQQLAERVGRTDGFQHEPGVMKNHVRIFAGYSTRWDGAIASFYPCKGQTLHGVVVQLTNKELTKLDKFEGGYIRIKKRVYVSSRPDSYIMAHVYLKTNQVFSQMPSTAYLTAIHKNINQDVIPIYGVKPDGTGIMRKAIWKKNKGIILPKA